MKRKLIYLLAALVILIWLELEFFNVLGTDYPFYGLLKISSIFSLAFPLICLVSLVEKKLFERSRQCPVTITVDDNELSWLNLSGTESITETNPFSSASHLLHDITAFEKSLGHLLRRIHVDTKKRLASFVVLKLDDSRLSELEKNEIPKVVERAGALACLIVDKNLPESKVQCQVRNFAYDTILDCI